MATESRVITVAQLNAFARDLLEGQFPSVWVEGELSNLAQPSSGHLYFTLKDEQAQVRAAMFKGRRTYLNFAPQNGLKVVARAKVSLYAPRGDYQLIVEQMEPAGVGALQRAFEQLKARLATEGLFDVSLKKPLPEHPSHIAVITSPTGAAVRDILSVLRRRFPLLPVTILPVAVQGKEAAPQICSALEAANRAGLFDVIILARGGGSIEDLWAFNEEPVARAIHDSQIPVISGVGHETDFTIADFVADIRAPTPSAAAELVSPNGQEMSDIFAGYELLISRHLNQQLRTHQIRVAQLRQRLKHPGRRLQELRQRLDELDLRLTRQVNNRLAHARLRLSGSETSLKKSMPTGQLQQAKHTTDTLRARLERWMTDHIARNKQQVAFLAHRAHSASPMATLARGYAIIEGPDGIVQKAADLSIGDTITARLHEGSLTAQVKVIKG